MNRWSQAKTWIAGACMVLALADLAAPAATAPAPPPELLPRLQEIYEARAKALLQDGDAATLVPLYDQSTSAGRWALEHEQRKIRYVHAWARNRHLLFTEAVPQLRVHRADVRGNTARVVLSQILQLGYVYPDGEGADMVNRFGIGTRHYAEFMVKNGQWVVRREWYTDPLGDDTLVPDIEPAGGQLEPRLSVPVVADPAGANTEAARRFYDRQGAVAYADKYCGAAWGCGNNNKYNPRYRDYTGLGGDCTNFVSQALGDKEGGKLPMGHGWHWYGGAGSTAWVQTDAFAGFLQYSGRARRVARGGFRDVTKPTERHPEGAIRQLRLGDVIGYEEKGDIQHFAIVTGFDSRGYPLVNAHTADRYRSPWDLGWDRRTTFWLFRIRD